MALGYLALNLIMMEDHVQHLERRVERQLLRTTENPFDLTNNEFRELYRLTPDLIFDLVDALEPRLQRTRITGLAVEKQVIRIAICTIYKIFLFYYIYYSYLFFI